MCSYPEAVRLDIVDRVHGHDIPDPYRWLEDPANPRTVAWSAAQDELAQARLDALPGRDRLAATLTRLLSTGWVSTPGWHDLGGPTELDTAAPGAVELPAVHTRQVQFASADGTAVRMFVISPSDSPDRPRPALLTGYGGFDDFAAAADTLLARGWTRPEQLAISGGSNGGLLVGAALTQRPDAYRAVVCSAPLLDMVRYEQFALGRTWNDEYGSAAEEAELEWLLSYSPYHRVRPGSCYPAVLFTVFDSDTRVDPCHARKMCAALQHATASDLASAPVLLRRETEVGHAARSVSRTVALLVDELAFLAEQTGLDLEVLPA